MAAGIEALDPHKQQLQEVGIKLSRAGISMVVAPIGNSASVALASELARMHDDLEAAFPPNPSHALIKPQKYSEMAAVVVTKDRTGKEVEDRDEGIPNDEIVSRLGLRVLARINFTQGSEYHDRLNAGQIIIAAAGSTTKG